MGKTHRTWIPRNFPARVFRVVVDTCQHLLCKCDLSSLGVKGTSQRKSHVTDLEDEETAVKGASHDKYPCEDLWLGGECSEDLRGQSVQEYRGKAKRWARATS